MKKLLLSLLSLMGWGFAALAQSHINIELLSATYTAPAVQFRVSWSSIPAVTGQTHNAKIWLWVDFIKIENNQPSGTWTRATISGTPTVSSSPTSTATLDASTNKGFWLNGVTGSYSATVTISISNIPVNNKFNWCAYASDCPPNVTAANGTYTFKGTPPFTLIAANDDTQTVTGTTLAASALTVTPTTIIDNTACPGVFCPYQGSDLYIDATHLCQQRTSGAQNWEAWIKDMRDDKFYRIVYMPDANWWLAQNIKLANYNGSAVGAAISNCTNEDDCGRSYAWAQVYASYAGGSSSSTGIVQGICPPGWLLPIRATFSTLANSIGNESAVCDALRPLNARCTPINDMYGWSSVIGIENGSISKNSSYCYTNDAGREDGFMTDVNSSDNYVCGRVRIGNNGDGSAAMVRCFRSL